ncbi:hypothetical protein MMC22_005564 [Lobaria immixta]|nr:hypothetical protein [Lobaria immixta]
MNAAKSSQGMFITLSQTPNAKLTQANTSGVSSRRGKRKSKQAARKNGNTSEIEVKEARRPIKGKFFKRAGKYALDEAIKQERNEVEEQQLENIKTWHNKTVGAAPPLALAITLPQGQGQKRKREPSSLDPEGDEENTRPAKRQEWAFNIDPALLHLGGSGEASNAFVDSAPELGPLDPFVNSPRRPSEAPELPAQIHNPGAHEFEFGQHIDVSTIANEGSSGPDEETPLYMDPLAAAGPYYLNHPQLQAFAKEQLSDHEVDFRWIRPRSQMDEVSIRAALQYTRKDCRERLGVSTLDVPSTSWETYSHQYLEIQAFFRQLGGYLGGDEEVPSLVCLEAWDGGFDDWKAPSVELD